MQYHEILELVKAVSKAGLSNFEYTEGNIHIAMSCQGESQKGQENSVLSVHEGDQHFELPVAPAIPAASAQETAPMPAASAPAEAEAPAVSAAPAPQAEEKSGNIVKSPLVGTFYAAPSEDAPAFVKVGDAVSKGQTVGIVEAMKLMNEIESEFDGVVTEIFVQNEETVEYGQPLFRIG